MTAAILAGTIDLAFAVFHMLFWRAFGWPEQLHGSGPMNTAVTQTMNAVLIYCFAAYGAALIYLALQPSAAAIAAVFALAGAGGWTLRTVLQFVYFPMQPRSSQAFTAVFVLAAALHGLAAWQF